MVPRAAAAATSFDFTADLSAVMEESLIALQKEQEFEEQFEARCSQEAEARLGRCEHDLCRQYEAAVKR